MSFLTNRGREKIARYNRHIANVKRYGDRYYALKNVFTPEEMAQMGFPRPQPILEVSGGGAGFSAPSSFPSIIPIAGTGGMDAANLNNTMQTEQKENEQIREIEMVTGSVVQNMATNINVKLKYKGMADNYKTLIRGLMAERRHIITFTNTDGLSQEDILKIFESLWARNTSLQNEVIELLEQYEIGPNDLINATDKNADIVVYKLIGKTREFNRRILQIFSKYYNMKGDEFKSRRRNIFNPSGENLPLQSPAVERLVNEQAIADMLQRIGFNVPQTDTILNLLENYFIEAYNNNRLGLSVFDRTDQQLSNTLFEYYKKINELFGALDERISGKMQINGELIVTTLTRFVKDSIARLPFIQFIAGVREIFNQFTRDAPGYNMPESQAGGSSSSSSSSAGLPQTNRLSGIELMRIYREERRNSYDSNTSDESNDYDDDRGTEIDSDSEMEDVDGLNLIADPPRSRLDVIGDEVRNALSGWLLSGRGLYMRLSQGPPDDPDGNYIQILWNGRWRIIKPSLLIAVLVAAGFGLKKIIDILKNLQRNEAYDVKKDPDSKPGPDQTLDPDEPLDPGQVEPGPIDPDIKPGTGAGEGASDTTTGHPTTSSNIDDVAHINAIDPAEVQLFRSPDSAEVVDQRKFINFSTVKSIDTGDDKSLYRATMKNEMNIMKKSLLDQTVETAGIVKNPEPSDANKPAIGQHSISQTARQQRIVWVPVVQSDDHFDDAFYTDKKPLWTAPIPRDNKPYTFENPNSIYFPEYHLYNKRTRPVNVRPDNYQGLIQGAYMAFDNSGLSYGLSEAQQQQTAFNHARNNQSFYDRPRNGSTRLL